MPKKYKSDFERRIARNLRSRKIKVVYEPFRIKFTKEVTYTPDWVLPNGIIVESKGNFRPADRSKHLLIKEQHPEYDIRFLFIRNNKITKKSKTRYSDWCEQYGFKYAFLKIPQEWIDE